MPQTDARAAAREGPPPQDDQLPAEATAPRSPVTVAQLVVQLLVAALRYAAAGWPAFPCRPGSKEPLTRHGFKDASTDPAVIRAWWTRWPDANVAIATGTPGPDVLDVDNGDDSGWSAFNRLQRGGLLAGAFAFVRTRSGGLHAYYAGTGQRCTAKIGGAALDYRAAGGYVLAPPSYVGADAKGPAGRYEVIDRRPMTGTPFDLAAATAVLVPSKPRRQGRRGPARRAVRARSRHGSARTLIPDTGMSRCGGWPRSWPMPASSTTRAPRSSSKQRKRSAWTAASGKRAPSSGPTEVQLDHAGSSQARGPGREAQRSRI